MMKNDLKWLENSKWLAKMTENDEKMNKLSNHYTDDDDDESDKHI